MNRKFRLVICLVLALLMLLSSTALAITAEPVKSLAFSKTTMTLEEGITGTIVPVGATALQLKWSSSDEKIAKVDANGTVSAVKSGKATITASVGTLSATCAVTVIDRAAPVSLRVPVYERSNPGNDPEDKSYWSRWITENALKDINIKVSWVPITRTNENVVMSLLLASGEAPDMMTHYDFPAFTSWYGRGALQEITKENLNQNGVNLKKAVPKAALDAGIIGGKQFGIGGKRIISYYFMSLIRQDWLDKVGMKMPTNHEEQYQVLKAFKEKQLGGAGTIPLAMSLQDLTDPVANYPWRKDNVSPEEIAMYSDVTAPALTWYPEKARLKYLNKLFNEGLISPEFPLDREGHNRDASFMNGKVGIFALQMSPNPPIVQTLMKNVPTAKIATLPQFNTVYGGQPQGRAYWEFGMLTGINAKYKNPEAVIKYLDWMARPEVMFTLQNGIEGKNYNMVSGKMVKVANFAGPERLMNGTNKDYYAPVLESTTADAGTPEKNMLAEAEVRCPPGFQYLEVDNFKYLEGANLYIDYVFPEPVTSMTSAASNLRTQFGIIATRLLMCKPSDFDKKYDAACKQYLSMGYQVVLNQRKAIYNKYK